MDINLEYYRAFYHVTKAGSITAAAETLCISQPAVSQAIKQLETALNSKLFMRTSKGVYLTKEGELLFAYVERGLESILDGEAMLRRMQDLEAGEIRIGASDMTLQFYLLPYLEKFHEQYPRIKVMVSNAPTPETMESLHEGRIDFGVVSTPVNPDSGVELLPVREIEDIFVAGEKFSELNGKLLDYSCLETLPCIVLEEKTSTRTFADNYLASKHVVLHPEFELATSDMVVQFAVRNLGIGLVVRDFAKERLKTGELFQLQFKEKMPKRQICIAADRSNPMSPAGTRLLELLKQQT